MRKFSLLICMIFCAISLNAQLKTFKGAWFDIKYPSSFKAKGSQKSMSASGWESATFKSPDGLVEFYVFSPQWRADVNDIDITANEKLVSKDSSMKGSEKSVWWTIAAKNGGYIRSYQESSNEEFNTNRVFGIKYKNAAALAKYKTQYEAFKKTLTQYAD